MKWGLRFFLSLALLFLLIGKSFAQLNPGDIAIIQYNADNADNIAFVALEDIAAGEIIKFSDNGWFAANSWRTGEGVHTYTVPAGGLTCGDIITITLSGPALSGSGDQIIAYQGISTMIFAINSEGTHVWQADATSSNTSALPQGLTNGTNAVALTEIDNAIYTGATTGTKAQLLSWICDYNNWAGSNTVNQTFSGTITNTDCSVSPLLSVSLPTLTGFNYIEGSGPSASQSYDLSGTNLTGAPGNITITAPTNYEVSLDNSTFSASVNVAYATATLSATTIYVRLKVGLSAGTYNGELVANAGGGASTVNVTCDGTVTGPILNSSVATLSGFIYVLGSGPSPSQNFDIDGSSLNPAAGNITVTAPTNYEVSLDNTSFSASVNAAYAANTLASTTIYVRLISGLALGNYTGNISISGGGASSLSISLDGDVVSVPTPFEKGDFAILGVNSNISCIGGYSGGDDEISFITFRDIQNGDAFFMTDNGYERVNAGQWGNTEGVLQATRTGGILPAGTVITFRFQNGGIYNSVSPDASWSIVEVHTTGTDLILNSGGDQIYFMQGGTWNYGTPGNHDAVYTPGQFLYAFNTNISWTSFGGTTQQSGLIIGMECFNMMPGSATDYVEYTGSTSPATKRDWMNRLNDPLNWTDRTDCATYEASKIHFGQSYTILAGGYSAGIWTGDENIDWFDCGNWQNLEVPDLSVNVVIPSVGVSNEPRIGDPPSAPVAYVSAECNDIDVQSSRTLTMNHVNSRLDVYGDINVDGSFSASNGLVNIFDDNSSLTATNPIGFYNLTLNKSTSGNTFTIANDITLASTLTLTNGILTTGTNWAIATNTATGSVMGHSTNSYINGNLRRYVSATGSYDFPVGTADYYEYSNINLNSSLTLSFINASFTNPHVTAINITALALTVGGTILDELLDYGFWTITPDAGTYNYDVALTSRGHTNPGATPEVHAVVKRSNSGSNWLSQGTHNNADQSMGAGWVTAKRKALTVFSDFAIAKSNEGPLPVELITFDAELEDYKGVISWRTASESNSSHYVLQRSFGDQSHFEHIATISAAGNSNVENSYSFIDENIKTGINYYKLLQYDFDGTEHIAAYDYIILSTDYMPLSVANFTISNGFLAADVYNIHGSALIIEIIDEQGRLIISQSYDVLEEAYRLKIIQPQNAGIYFLRLSDAKHSVSVKFFAM